MSDGAMRTDVLRVLAEHGVTAEQTDGADFYRLSTQDVTRVFRLCPVVSGSTCDLFHRLFSIPKAKFYPPIKGPQVVPIDRKVAGLP